MRDLRGFLRDALAALREGSAARALEQLDVVSRVAPSLPVVASLRAQALAELGHAEEALAESKRSLSLAPGAVATHSSHARVLHTLGRPADALDVLRSAADTGLCTPELLRLRGRIALEMGALEEAAGCAQALDSEGHPCMDLEAALAEAAHDYRKAWAVLRRCPDLDLALKTRAARLAPRAGALDELLSWAKHWQVPSNGRGASALHFALGDAYDAARQWHEAFEHYTEANRIARCTYDPKSREESARRGAERWWRAPAAVNEDERLVFIVGMPRSGTTLLERMLASHPEVEGLGERDVIARAARSTHSVDALAAALLEELPSGVRRCVDKTPHNFLHVATIARLFPRARVIHLERNPLDTCWSCFTKDFHQSHDYASRFADLAHHYAFQKRFTRAGLSESGLSWTRLSYEALVQEPERELRRVLEFLSLPFSPSCLEFQSRADSVTSASRHQVNQPLRRDRVGRAALYGERLAPLRAALEAHGL